VRASLLTLVPPWGPPVGAKKQSRAFGVFAELASSEGDGVRAWLFTACDDHGDARMGVGMRRSFTTREGAAREQTAPDVSGS
jgi:hypothetical protein